MSCVIDSGGTLVTHEHATLATGVRETLVVSSIVVHAPQGMP